MLRAWQARGTDYELEWGGRTWTLAVDTPSPGLRTAEAGWGPVLGLEGVAAIGRWAPHALSGATLVGCERHFERIEATFAPLGWGGLTVRAAWGPAADEGVDLEVQVSAISVDELKALEVVVASRVPEPPGSKPNPRWKHWVEPRDARSASLTYDGREPDLRDWTTLPIALDEPLAPRVLSVAPQSYVELVHPHDVARRIVATSRLSQLGHTTRYGLFGHDLEKGVVLRARLRGHWTSAESPQEEAKRLYSRFLHEPLPLGT
ncbi:MAG: hypothetical protein P4L84_07455 [Isosphaeraceae bacterium]|nr:hypothetical protein [Isosphaeraceae bacterium]